jgi:uncharacterized protein
MAERPDYHSLQQALSQAEADLAAAEAHGVLCGMYCAAGTVALESWLTQVFEVLDLESAHTRSACQLLVGLHENTREQLNDSDVLFELFLPDDETALADRTYALAEWCHGFVFGLAAGGLKRETVLPADTAELIADIVAISRAGVDDTGTDDTDEDAYMQLCEYVRMGVLLITEELQPVPPGPGSTSPTNNKTH